MFFFNKRPNSWGLLFHKDRRSRNFGRRHNNGIGRDFKMYSQGLE